MNLKAHIIQFIVMVIVGMMFNPMNMLAFRFTDLYTSLTLFYGGILMASNMVWAHEIVHYLSMGHFNYLVFCIGILMSTVTTIFLLRKQLFVNDNQWLKRMISHHSTALTTSNIVKERTNNDKIKKLANDIIETQEREISMMKNMVHAEPQTKL